MSNTIDNIFDLEAARRGGCRLAYILNNEQPVKCSIISDQPLFYMDFECEEDIEDEFDEMFDFTHVEASVAALQARIEELERFNSSYDSEDLEGRLDRFSEAAASLTMDSDHNQVDQDIAFLEKSLRKSRIASSFIDFARSYGSKIVYDSQVDGAVYDRSSGHILVQPALDMDDQILLVSRELRRVWQHRHGALINPLTFHPDQAVLVNRAQIADLSVTMTRIAWELQLAGEKGPWARIENSSMADLARSFARESYLDFRSLNNGSAQSAVFETWFLSERCHFEDKQLIQMMLADYQGYVFDTRQSSQSVTAELICALGTMPFGKNYLAPYVDTILNDEIFTEIRDRSNANFLWFIKFERSFRETEQELQTSDYSDHEFNHDHFNHNHIRFGDHEKETEIIHLPEGRNPSASSKARSEEKSGNIIQFRHRSGNI
jgi:hypothetical protein